MTGYTHRRLKSHARKGEELSALCGGSGRLVTIATSFVEEPTCSKCRAMLGLSKIKSERPKGTNAGSGDPWRGA